MTGRALSKRMLPGVLGLIFLAGCVQPGPSRRPADFLQPEALGLQAPGSLSAQDVVWSDLGDEQLKRLVRLALADSPNMILARARIERSLAVAGMTRGASGPQVALGAELTSQRYSANGLIPKPIAGNTWESGIIQAGFSWSPDFFGLHAAELAAALGQVRASQAEAAAAAAMLRTQVGKVYVSLALALAMRGLEARTLTQRQEIYRLTRERVAAGLDSRVELVQAEALLPEARARIDRLDEQTGLLRRQLAVLCGQPPQAFEQIEPALDQLSHKPLVARKLGLDLLGRRPEVVAAKWRVEAATQDVAQARAQFYPNLSLSAFAGLTALGLGQLFELGSRQMGITPALRLPLFDSGRLKAQFGARQAEVDVAIGQYNQVLLEAVREAGDAVLSAESLRRQSHEQDEAGRIAETAWMLARRRHEAGLGNYLLVLHAQTHWLNQQRRLLEVRAQRLDNELTLLKALGGGWHEREIRDGNE